MKVIAYYTNAFYAAKAMDLAQSLELFGVPHEITEIKGRKTWHEAVSHKPAFILDRLRAHPGEDLLYTDADSLLRRPLPQAGLADCDMGIVLWKRSPDHAQEALTGTMYFKNIQIGRAHV